jgi:transposase
MTSIVKCKSGKFTYLYESTSYRDENGKPRNNRKCIGRIDPETGEEKYNLDYLERQWTKNNQLLLSDQKFYSDNDLKNLVCKEYGVNYLMDNIVNSIGLTETLKRSLPETWEHVLTLAEYMVATGEPAMYCKYWLRKCEGFNSNELTSQKISNLLMAISYEERQNFYDNWAKKRLENELFALDITSISSYSELVEYVAWGYNRDKEKLAQVNVCMLVGEKSRLPIFQMEYNGAIKDVSTLKTTLSVASGINLSNISIVMDKGFSSKQNIDFMLSKKEITRFLISLPFTMKFAKDAVNDVRSYIENSNNTIVIGDDVIRGISKSVLWNSEHKLYVHIFFNPDHAFKRHEELCKNALELKKIVLSNKATKEYSGDFIKYLDIQHVSTNKEGMKVLIRDDVIKKEILYTGFLVTISNFVSKAETAIKLYRDKDVVEKAFYRLKNFLDFGRLRIHSGRVMENKLFVGFISLIIISHIHRVMLDKGLYKNMTMRELLKELETVTVVNVKGKKILHPLTSTQKEIISAFGFPLPV